MTPEFVIKVIEAEQPDGILVTFGGQTALNCGLDLWRRDIFNKYNVKVKKDEKELNNRYLELLCNPSNQLKTGNSLQKLWLKLERYFILFM